MDINIGIQPKIIVVDDQPVVLNTVVSILKPLYRVIPLTSGRAALAYMENQTPDLIILDFQMPEMSGLEVLERLKTNDRLQTVPVVFLTGSVGGDTEVLVLERGASDYIQKPVKARVLLTRIRLQLELARYRNHMEALVDEKTREMRLREDIALNLLAEATDMRDHETGGHIDRTTEIVRILVRYLMESPQSGYTLTPQEAEDIVKSAKLHDIGKIAIPDSILLKPGKLDDDEFEIIKQHPVHGARLLDDHNTLTGKDSFLRTARDIALYHHEKWNGRGYPDGLSEDGIPLPARITALADVYDALTSERPYKKSFTHEHAMEIINEESGSQFDPLLVPVMLHNERRIREISLTKNPLRWSFT